MIYGIVGAGGAGREAAWALRRSIPAVKEHELCFVVEQSEFALIDGFRVILLHDFKKLVENKLYALVVAIGDPRTKHRVVDKLLAAGLDQFFVLDGRDEAFGSAFVMPGPNAIAGPGSVIQALSLVLPGAKIGRFVHLNIYSYVAHDAIVEDYVTLCPRASVNGNCVVEEGAYLGTGAMLRQGVRVGAWATIGMGAVVVRDVPAGMTVFGNPGRPIGASS